MKKVTTLKCDDIVLQDLYLHFPNFYFKTGIENKAIYIQTNVSLSIVIGVLLEYVYVLYKDNKIDKKEVQDILDLISVYHEDFK